MTDRPLTTEQVTESPWIRRSFKLLTNGENKGIDALHIAFTVLNEIEDADELEAAIRYLVSRFQIRIRSQIRQGGRYGCTSCD